MENTYLNVMSFPIIKSNYAIISGCSEGGKSTLLSELASRGYQIILEPGRQIIKEQTLITAKVKRTEGKDYLLMQSC